MTLSTNLSNLHYDKQMFKYPTQAPHREGERERAKRTRIYTFILSRICTMSTRSPLKQVQNGEIVQIHASITLALQLLLHRNNSKQRYSLSSLHSAHSAGKSCRCPLLFSTTPIHDPSLSNKELGIRSVRDNTPNEQVCIDCGCRMSE